MLVRRGNGREAFSRGRSYTQTLVAEGLRISCGVSGDVIRVAVESPFIRQIAWARGAA
jgi:hypothetical protein